MAEMSPSDTVEAVSDGSGRKVVRTPSGKCVPLDEMPFGELAKIATEIEANVFVLIQFPLFAEGGVAAESIYRLACELVGDSAPERMSLRAVLEAFDTVPDDEPSLWVDGLPPTGDQTTA